MSLRFAQTCTPGCACRKHRFVAGIMHHRHRRGCSCTTPMLPNNVRRTSPPWKPGSRTPVCARQTGGGARPGPTGRPDRPAVARGHRRTDWAGSDEWALTDYVVHRSRHAAVMAPEPAGQFCILSSSDQGCRCWADRDRAVVTNWINLQYYASTVDNQRYGSGARSCTTWWAATSVLKEQRRPAHRPADAVHPMARNFATPAAAERVHQAPRRHRRRDGPTPPCHLMDHAG
jgi:hypothetical protein